jgi:hypothetical protein
MEVCVDEITYGLLGTIVIVSSIASAVVIGVICSLFEM